MKKGSLRENFASHFFCFVGFQFQVAFPPKSAEFYLTLVIIIIMGGIKYYQEGKKRK